MSERTYTRQDVDDIVAPWLKLCKEQSDELAELEADNRKLSEIEQRRISEAIAQADSIAILREQLGNWRNGNE